MGKGLYAKVTENTQNEAETTPKKRTINPLYILSNFTISIGLLKWKRFRSTWFIVGFASPTKSYLLAEVILFHFLVGRRFF
jgi:hypothetical protein